MILELIHFFLRKIFNFFFFSREVKHIDLQLPEAPQPLYTYNPTLSLEPSLVKKFKEKTISSVDLQNQSSSSSAVPATFKKRKIMGGSKNVRQRVDDE